MSARDPNANDTDRVGVALRALRGVDCDDDLIELRRLAYAIAVEVVEHEQSVIGAEHNLAIELAGALDGATQLGVFSLDFTLVDHRVVAHRAERHARVWLRADLQNPVQLLRRVGCDNGAGRSHSCNTERFAKIAPQLGAARVSRRLVEPCVAERGPTVLGVLGAAEEDLDTVIRKQDRRSRHALSHAWQ